MNPAVASIVGGAIVAVITGIFVWIGRREDAKATREVAAAARELEGRKVDLDYFREYRESTDARLERMERELGAERRARQEADRRAAAAEERATAADRRAVAAERRADHLEQRVAQLECALHREDIAIPPEVDQA